MLTLTPIEKVISESRVVVFAPHYDDALFMLGNCAFGWQNTGTSKQVRVILVFSRSNYMQGGGQDNFDVRLSRQKLASGHRLIEDAECLDALFGRFRYDYELLGEKECFLRGKTYAKDAMEFPHGMYEDFSEEDWQIFERMERRIEHWAGFDDTALVVPLAIKEHIDHFIVREAAVRVAEAMGERAKASFYFQEDKPYGGIAAAAELQRVSVFLESHPMERLIYRADPERMVDLAFTHYLSQVEHLYRVGIHSRADALGAEFGINAPCDQVYKYATGG